MQETEQKKKKRKQTQTTVLQTEEVSESGQDLIAFLEELEKTKEYLEVQICPKCKSPKVKRSGTQEGDLWSHMGIVTPKYECSDCGWSGRTVVKVTNRPLTVRDVELIAEALDVDEK
jgi:hypothetical protein